MQGSGFLAIAALEARDT